MTIGGALIVLKALTYDHFLANRLFEGRMGLAVGSATLALAALITEIQSWSQPGFILVEFFLFSLGAFIIINSTTRTPAFYSELNVKVATLVGFSTTSFIFAYYALTTFPGSPVYLAFVAAGIVGVVCMVLRKAASSLSLILIAMIAVFAVLLMYTVPVLSTDELALDSYAAHLVLLGINPYLPGVMKNAFSYYHLSLFYETPISTGLCELAFISRAFVPSIYSRGCPWNRSKDRASCLDCCPSYRNLLKVQEVWMAFNSAHTYSAS